MNIVFDAWTPPIGTISILLVSAAIYIQGFRRLHRQMPGRFPNWRLAAFLGGIATLLIAIASPLEDFDEQLLQVPMTQHLILMLVPPTLLLAVRPPFVFAPPPPPP